MISPERQALALVIATRAALQAPPAVRPSGDELALLADALHTAGHALPVGGAFRAMIVACSSVGGCTRPGAGSRVRHARALSDLDAAALFLHGAS